MTFRDYSVFGLRVRSEIPLPELFEAVGTSAPDVTVSTGPVPEADPAQPGLRAVDGALLLVVPKVGRFRIEAGTNIIVEAEGGVPDRNVRVFLLGSAFGALLHQRGLLPLHANAVEIDGKAVCFMGESGSGKSTLAAWFHDQGHRVIADDVCVIGFNADGRAMANPGLPRLRLWKEVVEARGLDVSSLQQSYVGAEVSEKYDVPVAARAAASGDMPVAAVYLLSTGSQLEISIMQGISAVEALFANTYRGQFLPLAGSYATHWSSCMRLARTVPVFRFERRWGIDHMDSDCRAVLRQAEGTINNSR